MFYFLVVYDCSGGRFSDDFYLAASNIFQELVDEAVSEITNGDMEGGTIYKADFGTNPEELLHIGCHEVEKEYVCSINHPDLQGAPDEFYWCRICNIIFPSAGKCSECKKSLRNTAGEVEVESESEPESHPDPESYPEPLSDPEWCSDPESCSESDE